MGEKLYDELGKEFVKNGKVLLGHNRKKTIGKLSDETAHPFVIDNRYVFMHNGTLRNHEKLHKTEVDSEALGMHLTRCEGDPGAIEKALADVDGAYACMWIDQEQSKVFLLRNHERPLFVAKTNIGLIIGSEYGFIAAAALRNRVEFKDCKAIETDTLYTIDVSGYDCPMKEDKLTVKKSTPLLTFTKGGHTKATGTAGAGTDENEVSKNSFKRIRKAWIGKQIGFFLDDYLPRVANDPTPTEFIVWGEVEAIEFQHKFQGILKNTTEDEVLWTFDSVPVYGQIEDVVYDPKGKSVIFQMSNLSAVPASNVKEMVH